jgi:two-component system sensor histidine kinase/response regulator
MDSDDSMKDEVIARLLRANKELEAFIYSASHDLKGPLASSRGLTGLALSSQSVPEKNEYLEMVDTTLEKLDNILVGLHDVALIRHGKPVLEKINIENILLDLLNNFKGYPNFNQVKFIIRNEFNNEFFSDEIIVQTILRNIIENGIKYAKHGMSDSYVKVLIRESGSGVLLEISDNGIGIPGEFHDKVFDSFFRASDTSSGSGLGLYIVKNAVDKLNGKIEISESEERDGTLFHLYLPSNASQVALNLF